MNFNHRWNRATSATATSFLMMQHHEKQLRQKWEKSPLHKGCNWIKRVWKSFFSIFSSLKQSHCTPFKLLKWPFVLSQFKGQSDVALVNDVLCYRNRHKNTIFLFIWPLLMSKPKTTIVHYLNRRGANNVLWALAKNSKILINLRVWNC